MNVKKALACATLVIMVWQLCSCSKESSVEKNGTVSSDGYYIKGKKDGKEFNFTAVAQATRVDFAGTRMSSLALIAKPNLTSLEGLTLEMNFSNGAAVSPGKYNENNSLNTNVVVAGVYAYNSTTVLYGAGIVSPSAKPMEIEVLTLTDKEISGTFSGAFYKQDASTGTAPTPASEKIIITEGEFKLPLK